MKKRLLSAMIAVMLIVGLVVVDRNDHSFAQESVAEQMTAESGASESKSQEAENTLPANNAAEPSQDQDPASTSDANVTASTDGTTVEPIPTKQPDQDQATASTTAGGTDPAADPTKVEPDPTKATADSTKATDPAAPTVDPTKPVGEVVQAVQSPLQDGIKSVIFIDNSGKELDKILTRETFGNINMKVVIDLSGREVKEGDHISIRYPEDFILKGSTRTLKDLQDESIELADFIIEPSTSGGGIAKIVFKKDAENRDNIRGEVFFSSAIKAQPENTKKAFTLTLDGSTPGEKPIDTNTVSFGISSVKWSYIYDEAIYKNGFSDKTEPKMNYNIRINRMKRELGDVVVEDTLSPRGRIVQFLPETFKLYQGDFGDKVFGDGTGVVLFNQREIPLIEGDNLFFNESRTSFKVYIPNVGTDSYYLEYRTNHHNDGMTILNEAILYSDGEIIQPYSLIVHRYATTGEEVSRDDFPTRFQGHKITRYAFAVGNAQIQSDMKGKLMIQKSDKDGNLLSGAEFRIYKDAKLTEEVFGTPFVTDETGTVIVDKLSAKVKYWIKETKAPTGYKLSEEIKSITINAATSNFLTFENEAETVTVSATKKWVGGAVGDHQTTLRLMKNGEIAKNQWGKILEEKIQGDQSVRWENLPTVDKKGQEIKYSIIEADKPENYEATIEETAENEFMITNTYVEPKPTTQPPTSQPEQPTQPSQPPVVSGGSGGGSEIPSSPVRPNPPEFDIFDPSTPLSGKDKEMAEKKEQALKNERAFDTKEAEENAKTSLVAGAEQNKNSIEKIGSSPKTGAGVQLPIGRLMIAGLLLMIVREFSKRRD